MSVYVEAFDSEETWNGFRFPLQSYSVSRPLTRTLMSHRSQKATLGFAPMSLSAHDAMANTFMNKVYAIRIVDEDQPLGIYLRGVTPVSASAQNVYEFYVDQISTYELPVRTESAEVPEPPEPVPPTRLERSWGG